jgi:dCMP deaminase
MSAWPSRWFALADLVATWSKDRSRKVGAVVVGPRQEVLSLGWNGMPRGVNDDVPCRHEQPQKYAWAEHAERNAVYNAASRGIPLLGATLYLGGEVPFPCADCARAVVQTGITAVVMRGEPDWADPNHNFPIARQILREAGVGTWFLPQHAPREQSQVWAASGVGMADLQMGWVQTEPELDL